MINNSYLATILALLIHFLLEYPMEIANFMKNYLEKNILKWKEIPQ